jgi:Domain of unknown function (DUF3303)
LGHEAPAVLFMVVERFAPGTAPEIYRRVREGGRGLPDGVRYLDSWVRADLRGCFQLMESDSAAALQAWVASWGELADFEIVPVTASRETVDLMARLG